MRKPEPTVFVVDDDQAMRKSLHWLIESVGLSVETFPSARRFLETYTPGRPGCLVLDMRMPGISGLDLQEKLRARNIVLPVIFITGHGDVPMAVRAMKGGAIDFIEKPFNDQLLLDRIQHALEQDAQSRMGEAQRSELASRLALLTPREREVMEMVAEGKPNKVIASQLGVSAKTVEAHRAKVMEKMQAKSLADLIRMILAYESE